MPIKRDVNFSRSKPKAKPKAKTTKPTTSKKRKVTWSDATAAMRKAKKK